MSHMSEALVIRGPGHLDLEALPLRVPADSELIVEIKLGGICGSDLHYWKHGSSGSSVLTDPMILGHEVVGVVQQAAADGAGPVEGTPVAIHPATSCGICAQCTAGRSHLCLDGRYLGSAAHRPHTHGGFATSMVVPRQNVRPLPGGVPLEHFALAEPASVAWHAVSRAASVADQRVLVIGAGPIGLAIVAVLRLRGAGEIVVSDLFPRPLDTARRMGADRTTSPGDPGGAQLNVEFDVTFECSGTPAGLSQAVDATRGGGDVVMVGNQRVGDVPFPAARAISKELRISGSWRFQNEFDEVVSALATGELDLTPIITHIIDWRDYTRAFELASLPAESSKVLLAISPGHQSDAPARHHAQRAGHSGKTIL
jgi:L-idonate 5-dehydrogenase